MDLRTLEYALRNERGVEDVHVGWRGDELLAWVVLGSSADLEGLRQKTRARDSRLHDVVAVRRLPRDPEGRVDERRLTEDGYVEELLTQRWEESLRARPGLKTAAVVLRDDVDDAIGRLLLPESLGGQRSNLNSSAAPPAPETAIAAVSAGPALDLDGDHPSTWREALVRVAKRRPVRSVVCVDGQGTTTRLPYDALWQDSLRIAAGLRACGVPADAPLLVQLDSPADFLRLFWGGLVQGQPVVPLAAADFSRQQGARDSRPSPLPGQAAAPNPALDRLLHALESLPSSVVVTSAGHLDAVRRWLRSIGLASERAIAVEHLLAFAPLDFERLPPLEPDAIALVFLTSGSTGKPKFVPQTHRRLLAHAKASIEARGERAEDVSVNWIPLDHVGGCIMFCLDDTYVGANQVHAASSWVLADPLRWLDLLHEHRAAFTWSPNFGYALLVEQAERTGNRQWDLSSVRMFINGGEAVVEQTARRFVELLSRHGLRPGTMRPAYGMSELCSVITYGVSDAADQAGTPLEARGSRHERNPSVGLPIPGVELRITDEQDRVLREREVGHLQVRGPTVFDGYIRPSTQGSGASSRDRSCFTADGWFRTGDRARLIGGQLEITGREKEVVVVNGVKHPCQEIEAVVEQVPGTVASFVAATPARLAGDVTDRLVLLLHVDPAADLASVLSDVRATVTQRIGVAPSHVIPLRREAFPRTNIGKIERAKMRATFESGGYAAEERQASQLLGTARTVPDWFFRTTHRPRPLPLREPPVLRGTVLLVGDGDGLSAELAGALPQATVIRIEPGTGFQVVGRTVKLNLTSPEAIDRLLAWLPTAGRPQLEAIVHLGLARHDPSLDELAGAGLMGLVHLVRALDLRAADEPTALSAAPVRLLIATRRGQAVVDSEVVAPERAALSGLVRCLALEASKLSVRLVDLDVDEGGSSGTAHRLLGELTLGSGEAVVAYRRGRRLVSALSAFDPTRIESPLSSLVRRGTYVITGGLGGVGMALSRFLLTQYGARLVAIGRTAPDDRRVVERLNALRTLGDVGYEQADVTDPEALGSAFARIRARTERLEGVFHLAGVRHEGLLSEGDPAAWEDSLAVRVDGAVHLHQLLEDRPDALFVTFAEAVHATGGVGASAYAAAGSFLAGLVHARRLRGGRRSHLISFSPWSEVGMHRDHPARSLSVGRGFLDVGNREGIDSTWLLLAMGVPEALVGLDARNRYVAMHLDEGPIQVSRLYAFFERHADTPTDAEIASLGLADRYGSITRCDPRALPAIPRDTMGRPDRSRLQRAPLAELLSGGGAEGPRSDLERKIYGAWKGVLGAEPRGPNASFFAAGGDSLAAARLLSRLRDACGVQIPLDRVFADPTPAGLAARIQELGTSHGPRPIVRRARELYRALRSTQGHIDSAALLRALGRDQKDAR